MKMQIGVSSYSFAPLLRSGELDIFGVIDWVAGSRASHLEIATEGLGVDLVAEPNLVADIAGHAEAQRVPIANYVVGADFVRSEVAEQVASMRSHLDVAQGLGARRFRHDVAKWAWQESSQSELEAAFERIVPACREIADYGAQLGITTSVENHGFFMNSSDRIQRLISLVGRENFCTTLDVGNFLCVGEDPRSAVARNISSASVVHLKDFYIRNDEPGDGWLRTQAGNYLLGAIVGFGDMDLQNVISVIKRSGFDGPVSIEFEGISDSRAACAIGIDNAMRMWERI
jgi:sugar phosphate isomerase/epimerase